ncbi:hypothetical protein IE81DRAFT_346989 [Ceraceosorus guamensis]|uniref:chitin synthase n=1 Tax=Ceraceosorus guamensis TaxID=1522189 RepID=A0A316W2K4_9BASI|nr:hypothetical protein IE81DRAFT_346989 [Ceraceosorus guamensis]PWN43013.1 hypothetical protein IE81DRAFT_346989 [Ceraceosorus guamensis]
MAMRDPVPGAGPSADLVSLVTSTSSTTVQLSDDTVLSHLQQRFRSEQPYSRLGGTSLIVINPLRTLANLNDASADAYRKLYNEASWEQSGSLQPDDRLPPHPYEFATRVYHAMRRTKESQAVLYSGPTNSGKTFASKLLTQQLLRLSSNATKREAKLADQVRSFDTILNSFGAAKTKSNGNASRHGKYTELHFTEAGRLGAFKVLTFGLDKSRLCGPLASEERTFHVFYQLLAGATADERDQFRLEDVTSYPLLASSGCYRLAGGPSSDDGIAMEELRVALRSLGFKQKQTTAIFSLLSAILTLSCITFAEPDSNVMEADAAKITSREALEDVAILLGVDESELEQCLTTRTRMVRKEQVSSILSAAAAAHQRDVLARDLYATLFAYIVESANHKVCPAPDEHFPTQIVQLDVAGFQRKGPASSIAAPGAAGLPPSGHHEFSSANFPAEMVQNYLVRQIFDADGPLNAGPLADGIATPETQVTDNTSCVELLRGSASIGGPTDRKPGGLLGTLDKAMQKVRGGKAKEEDDTSLLAELDQHAGHMSYLASTNSTLASTAPQSQGGRRVFAVNHYQGQCTYDVQGFVSRELDVFDSSFVSMLRRSQVGFVGKLFAGPSLATEPHPLDASIVANAQVSVRPLRQPSTLAPDAPSVDPLLDPQRVYGISRQVNATISEILGAVRHAGRTWSVLALRPNDIDQPNSFDARRVKAQLRSMLLPEMASRKRSEYVQAMAFDAFCLRYSDSVIPAAAAAGVSEPREKIQAFAIANALRDGLDYALGHEKVWLGYSAWRRLEDRLRASEPSEVFADADPIERGSGGSPPTYPPGQLATRSASYLTPMGGDGDLGKAGFEDEDEQQLLRRPSGASNPFAGSIKDVASDNGWGGEWDKGAYGGALNPGMAGALEKSADLEGKGIDAVAEEPISAVRRWWTRFVWILTWWIPNWALSRCGGMKRPDVQMAWREKLTICMLIAFLCCFILFYVIAFGRILCPDQDRAWNDNQLSGFNDPEQKYYTAVRGKVYDLTSFAGGRHATGVTDEIMKQLGGQDLTPYFPVLPVVACPGLVQDANVQLTANGSSTYYTPTFPQAVHTSGTRAADQTSELASQNWYPQTLIPFLNKRYKGFYVVSTMDVRKAGSDGDRSWAIVHDNIYDLGDYVYTMSQNNGAVVGTTFLADSISSLFANQAGKDISKDFDEAMGALNSTARASHQQCLDNLFYIGKTDFRLTARCEAQNYILLAFSCIIMATIGAKFLAALQLAPKRNPEQQDKFVICQVPCYTEGEEELRKTIDSLAGLKYDDKRKLLFIICDGMIVGSGNELPTPRIVLDILGVDPKIDPEPLMFKSVAEGSKQLNYGKIYSGLYEFEGHVVPYVVVVKVGRPSERSRPGNRGKRDTQILLMRYLNRVHFDAPMFPLELEIYHQMKNVIGIDPAFYEYILMVDADTSVEPEGLNRLVSVAADDSRVIAICGETKVSNEEGSWWTMIQVYEYYISHHLAKAFESLFGSVTCLPGCFSMYRIRSADKGRPLFISSRIIDDYSDNRADTLHKKNLLSLGEDRYLTTLILKHFPAYRTKFTADAHAHTSTPDRWGILLSQRRRWINSTIHNLAELVLMPELCGFCFFSMRFIVFLDLMGTIILPATTVYLIYLIVTVATHNAAIPIISLAMIGAVYGLQAIIFLLKRQWQYIGWLIIYIMAYPVWSFFLPIYSFWHMDDFSWGNTRIVVGEKGNRKIIAGTDDEPFEDSMIPLKRFSEYQRDVLNEPTDAASMRSGFTGKSGAGPFGNNYAVGMGRSTPSLMGMPQLAHRGPSSAYAGSDAGSAVYGQPSAQADYFQNTNVLDQRQHSRQSSGALGGSKAASRMPSMAFGQQPAQQMPGMSPYASPMYGVQAPPMSMYSMGPQSMYMAPGMGMSTPSFSPFAGGIPPMQHSPAGSDAGGPPVIGPLMPQGTGSGIWPSSPPAQGGSATRAQSTYALGAGNTNPFATPVGAPSAPDALPTSLAMEVTDSELAASVRKYLASQTDLMSVSKRNVRDAVIAAYPKADLGSRKATINKAIDDTLSGAA